MADSFDAVIHGVGEVRSGMRRMSRNMDAASVAAMRAVQNRLKREVRKNLNNAPRWNHRGSWGSVPSVTLSGQPRHSPRSGGPGRFTGDMYKGVGSKRKLVVRVDGEVIGGVGVGGKINNLKKRRLEARFPYMRPAYDKVAPIMRAEYEKGWAKGLSRKGGL